MADVSDIPMWTVVAYKSGKFLGALHPQEGEFIRGEIHPTTLAVANAGVDGCIDNMIDTINNDADPEWDRLCGRGHEDAGPSGACAHDARCD